MSPLGEDSGSAAALAEKILTICDKGDRMIFFKGNLAKDTMCEVLENGGLLVEQLVVYETKESCDLKKDLAVLQPPHWVVLFSPSGARAALPLLPEESSFKLVAIGETVGFGQDPISLQGQPQGTRCCDWASTLQELHLNLPPRVCCQCSEAALQTEDISKFLLRTELSAQSHHLNIFSLQNAIFQILISLPFKMKKVKEKEAPDLSSLLVFGYACKLFRCLCLHANENNYHPIILRLSSSNVTLCLNSYPVLGPLITLM